VILAARPPDRGRQSISVTSVRLLGEAAVGRSAILNGGSRCMRC
jgi:hypothetical protein